MQFSALERLVEDSLEMAQTHQDPETEALLTEEIASAEQHIEALELETFLSGPFDDHAVTLTIRSGAGGVDAQDFAEMLLRMYLRYGERAGYQTRILEQVAGGEAGIKSATLEITGGDKPYGYLRREAGIHRLVRLSPFNANNLRQTSFAAVEVLPVIDNDQEITLRTEDIRIDTFRASGAGGQHVNTTDSAVRITHVPSGLVASCQSERSQLQNKEQALRILRGKLAQKKLEEQAIEDRKLKGEYKSAEWGNQIRSYVLHPYTLVKDHRTRVETSDATSVLDGGLELFIQSELRMLP